MCTLIHLGYKINLSLYIPYFPFYIFYKGNTMKQNFQHLQKNLYFSYQKQFSKISFKYVSLSTVSSVISNPDFVSIIGLPFLSIKL